MRIPSTTETKKYFAKLGYVVEHVADNEGCQTWQITGDDCALDGRKFATRLALWAEWMDYASERIRDQTKAKTFVDAFERADASQRSQLLAELQLYLDFESAPLVEKMFRHIPAADTDALPKNWKASIFSTISDPEMFLPFRFLVYRLLHRNGHKAQYIQRYTSP